MTADGGAHTPQREYLDPILRCLHELELEAPVQFDLQGNPAPWQGANESQIIDCIRQRMELTEADFELLTEDRPRFFTMIDNALYRVLTHGGLIERGTSGHFKLTVQGRGRVLDLERDP